MPLNQNSKTKRTSREKGIRERQFDLEEYRQHPPLIVKLHEDYKSLQVRYTTLEGKVKTVEDQLNAKDTELKLMRLKLKVLKERLVDREKQAILRTGLALVMTLLFGFGVNIVTAAPSYSWVGWLMIGAAGTLQFIDLFLNLGRRSQKNDWIDEQD